MQDEELEVAEETLKVSSTKQEPLELESKVDVVVTSSHKSKKKKKRKGKDGSLKSTDEVEEPLDAILENISLEATSYGNHGVPAKANTNTKAGNKLVKRHVPSILQVDAKFLNAENELRRIFGSKVVKSFEKSSQTGSSRQIRGGRHGTHTHRKTILVTPLDHWPRWDGSFSMEFLETRDGYHYFR